MSILDSRLYRWAEKATNFFLLTLLWLLVSLPVITLAPATTAMFGVLRAWEEREGAGIAEPFLATFRARFLQSLLVGFIWALLGGILAVDIVATRRMTGLIATPLFIATLSVTLCYLMLSLYIYPILAHARTGAFGVLRNAFLLALSQPLLSLVAACGLLLGALALWLFPFLIVVFGSVVAYGLNALFNRALRNFPSALPDDDAARGTAKREPETETEEAAPVGRGHTRGGG